MKAKKDAYTIIIVILIIGFLMVLTIGILKLVMDEMRDSSALGNYQKAYIGAESAQELALLQIKDKGYGYNEPSSSDFSEYILNENISGNRNIAKISYINQGSTDTAKGTIPPLGNVIMPLFIIDSSGNELKSENVVLSFDGIPHLENDKVSWNILSESGGMANTAENVATGKQKSETNFQLNYSDTETISDFLSKSENNKNYLLLFNGTSSEVNFEVESTDGNNITEPKLKILSTATVGGYKQNLKTTVDYEKIVNRAKYAIYSQ